MRHAAAAHQRLLFSQNLSSAKFLITDWLQMKMSHLSRSGSLLSLINLCRQSWELNFPALFLCCTMMTKPYMNSYLTALQVANLLLTFGEKVLGYDTRDFKMKTCKKGNIGV